MKILLRADASPTQGTGHVMRLLTLSEELFSAGHDVHLASAASGIPWLEDLISESRLARILVEAHSLDSALLDEISPDWLVVDSYEISAALISRARQHARVLAIIDGDGRGIEADLYVDHNVGAETLPWSPFIAQRILAGSQYALVRRAVREVRRAEPWRLSETKPRILCFMGGTDPSGMIIRVAQALADVTMSFSGTVVCAPAWQERVQATLSGKPDIKMISPTRDLPALMTAADIAISAAGTSSWELCTLGIPSILIEAAENQSQGLREMTERDLVVGITPRDFDEAGLTKEITKRVENLLLDERKRRDISQACLNTFDGLGAQRIASRMAAMTPDAR